MNSNASEAARDRISPWSAVIIFIAWMIPGLFGHEPWKPDEGYTIGLIHHIVETGDWVVPTLAGEPFMEKPPVFFITAALFGALLSPWLIPLHQAAAFATVFYIGLMLLFIYLTGREMGGKSMGLTAALALIGCVGLVVRAHTAITDTSLWCGFAVAGYGVALAERRWKAGAFWFGTGAGLAFMAKGFMGPAFIGLAVFLLPVFCPEKRGRRFLVFLFLSLAFSLPWLLVWPVALYLRSPELFSDWFWLNNIGRFLGPRFGFPALAQARGRSDYLTRFPWFTLPLWPPALCAWWNRGRAGLRDATLVFPSLVVAVGFAVLLMAAGQRELYMIPLLVPLAALAARGGDLLPVRADWPFRKLPMVVAGLGLSAIWVWWLAWMLGHPVVFSDRMENLVAASSVRTGFWGILAAALYTIAWIWLIPMQARFRRQWCWVWAGSLAALWGTCMLLFMPLMDHTNGYRSTFAAMVRYLPEDKTIAVDAYRFGESQRAILDYYFGRRTQALDSASPKPTARYLLAQNHRKRELYDPGDDWRILWQGARPGDQKEWYVLFERAPEASEDNDN